MRLQVLLIQFFQVALAEYLPGVSGYLGETIILPSGANSAWKLTKIEWSVFPNNTWIATYRNGTEKIGRIRQYKGRLGLSISSGNLTIHNLTRDDSMEYTVDLINSQRQSTVNKIKLTVRQHLMKPTITTLFTKPMEGGCWIGLRCSSQEERVDFSWQVEPLNVPAYNMSRSDGHGVLLGFIKTGQTFNFTCTSSKLEEKTSNVVPVKCDVLTEKPCTDRCGLCMFIGSFLIIIITVLYAYREKIKAELINLKNRLITKPGNDQ
ncbi:uncharacterized protein si:cabz01074946.1 [Toxotes jaculatrix]|uniref:uncharacterized protein si:cabz01074946.1 n=1 Tax=Toxotes jaculatrix TaxID=941984 RepID=UPI001B3ABED2|nr:uncharacterized protein si:cabz01074946.1 [Toxotes jaculatrix]